jgi:hypothetical protein
MTPALEVIFPENQGVRKSPLTVVDGRIVAENPA